MRPTVHYWKPLAWLLEQQGKTVVTVNPYHVQRRTEFGDTSLDKNDRKDAWLNARLVEKASLFHVHLPEAVYAELRNLTQLWQQHKPQIGAIMNQVQAMLDCELPWFGGRTNSWGVTRG